MNRLQAVALNEGLRSRKKLWREAGREQLESFQLAPWASRRQRDLLEMLDRLSPTIAELTQAIEQEVEKCAEAQRLRTHPGVGSLTALAFVLILGGAERLQCGKQIASYLGLVILFSGTPRRRFVCETLDRTTPENQSTIAVRVAYLYSFPQTPTTLA
jgi:transposase